LEIVALVTEQHKPVVEAVRNKSAIALQDAENYQNLMDEMQKLWGQG
jgi:PHD/YefM family antitoxin component YafN of YafNO toxin-antitoxin module